MSRFVFHLSARLISCARTFAVSAGVLSSLVVCASAAEPLWLAKTVPLRIMALGDSITAGVGERGADTGSGGYRAELVRLLDAHGYRYVMVGARSDFSAHIANRKHEGWPGYVIRSFRPDAAPQLYGRVTHDAIVSADPDVILLMAGTNDLLRKAKGVDGYTLPNIVQSMNALLAQIFYEKPRVTVILGGVVDSPNVHACDVAAFDGQPDCGTNTGPTLRTLVDAYAARGFHIALADGMEDVIPRDRMHFPDGIHPTGPNGYDAVARVWMTALESVTSSELGDKVAGR